MLMRWLAKVEGWEESEDEPDDLPEDLDPRLKELFQ
jgi:hypothetical protein